MGRARQEADRGNAVPSVRMVSTSGRRGEYEED